MTVKSPCPAGCGAMVEYEGDVAPFCETPLCVAQRELDKKTQAPRINDTLAASPNNITDSRPRQQRPTIVLLDAKGKPIVPEFNDDGDELPSPQPYKMPFAQLVSPVNGGSSRCNEHGKPAPCYVCENERNRVEADAFIQKLLAENGECEHHPGYPAGCCLRCQQKADRARADANLKKPAEKPEMSLEEMTKNFKANLGLNKPDNDDEPPSALSRRRFFQPLPEGQPIDLDGQTVLWRAGMSPRNIAMFLCMPEFLYDNYGQNKNNPPKWVYKTAEESYDRPTHKLPEEIVFFNPEDNSIKQQSHQQSEDWTVTPVSDKIKQRAEPIVIHVEAEPPRQMRRKIPAPSYLTEALAQEKAKQEPLTVRWNREHGGLTPEELERARVAQNRVVKKLQNQVDAYGRVQTIDDPTTGTAAWDITIPPCPEGCKQKWSPAFIVKYVTEAFNTHDYAEMGDWEYAELENQIIQRMYDWNFFRGWQRPGLSSSCDMARAQWQVDGRPKFGDEAFNDFYGWPANGKQNGNRNPFGLDTTAIENAETAYRYGESGRRDSSIRRVGPRGHGRDSEKD